MRRGASSQPPGMSRRLFLPGSVITCASNRRAPPPLEVLLGLAEFTSPSFALVVNQILFTDQYYGMFHNLEYTDMALSVSEEARKKLRVLIKRKKREMRLAFSDGPAP